MYILYMYTHVYIDIAILWCYSIAGVFDGKNSVDGLE